MRAVVQRVSRAEVSVAGSPVGRIGPGLVVLVGVCGDDDHADAVALADKIVGLRVFNDRRSAMNRSLHDTGGAVLVVSQFTLYADVRRGRRPSFVAAAPPDTAEPLVERVVERMREAGVTVETGRFGEMMEVELVNEGPVTILVETRSGRVV